MTDDKGQQRRHSTTPCESQIPDSEAGFLCEHLAQVIGSDALICWYLDKATLFSGADSCAQTAMIARAESAMPCESLTLDSEAGFLCGHLVEDLFTSAGVTP